MADITSANSVFSLSIPLLIPSPENIEGYATDDAFEADEIEVAETYMGVDGKLSAGFVFTAVPMNVSLQADSPSCDIFETLYANEKKLRKKFFMNAVIQFPSLGIKYTFKNGVMVTYPPMAAAKKTLGQRRFGIKWESVTPGVPT